MSEFEEGILLAELRGRLREISEHLREERKLLQEILERLPKPTYPQPVAAGSRLVVTE
jgi:hypothetical protein